MLNYEITLGTVGSSVFWALLVPFVAGFAWSAGCTLWARIVR